MRTWLKVFLLTLTVLLGGSALWVWAAVLTGNVGKAVVLTETNGFDIGGIIRANTFGLHQQSGDPTTGADWLLYAKSTGVHVRDPSGNVTGPFGTGSGGGSAAMTVARVATTANLTFPIVGTQTVDGVSVGAGGEIVLVKDQSTPTQNGPYIAANPGTWTRSTSFDTSAEFTAGFPVYVQSGTLNGGTVWNFSVIGTFTLGSTNATFVRTGLGNLGELLSHKDAASGYAGLTSASKQVWTQRGDAATHAAINLTGQITPTASTMRVSGSGGPVTLTTGNPRILGCTTSADDGIELTVEGSDATNTLTMPTGNGVKLCGNTGSLVLGLNLASAHFVCNGATAIWRQSNCPTLQTVANVGRTIVADETNPVIIANTAGSGRFERYVDSSTGKPTDRAICAGVACATTELTNPQFVASGSKPTCDATTRGLRWDTLGGAGVADILEVCQKSSADTYAWLAPGTKTTTIPLPVDTINFADANASIQPSDRTNYDTMVTQFEDNVTGCVHLKTYIPPNLASTPAWNMIIRHSAISGSGGNVVLTLAAKTFGNNVAKDAAFTALTLPSSGVVAVNTSANTTETTLGATDFDGTVSLAPSQMLRLTLCRTGGSGSDSLGVAWQVDAILLRVNVN